jgi:hypothetical protein
MRNVIVLVSFEEDLVLFNGSLSGISKELGLVNDVFETGVDDEFVLDCLEGELLNLLPGEISVCVNKVHLIDAIK